MFFGSFSVKLFLLWMVCFLGSEEVHSKQLRTDKVLKLRQWNRLAASVKRQHG